MKCGSLENPAETLMIDADGQRRSSSTRLSPVGKRVSLMTSLEWRAQEPREKRCLLLMLEGHIFVEAHEGYALGHLHSVRLLLSTPAAMFSIYIPDHLSPIGAACSGEALPNLGM